ncbi:hypothetical protein Q4485_07965 [Granulosicoccaceae sp. 1_MG-2023]|nr:hypothetical protein [Granulosicoccaceae sp. 1_MG-2023]
MTDSRSRSEHLSRWLLTALLLIAALLVVFRPLDNLGETYLDDAFKRAMLSFAVARGLNGVISVAQGTEFAVQPAGVGINFAPGEILDPVNDLVERFSWVMLVASSSLGAQKVLLAISSWAGITLLLLLTTGLYLASVWWPARTPLVQRSRVGRILVLFLVLRLAVPFSALLSEWSYRTFLDAQYTQASQELEAAADEIRSVNAEMPVAAQDSENPGMTDRLRRLYESALSQIDFETKLERYKAAAGRISENAVNMIVVYVLQTIVFPLGFFWLLVVLFRQIAV